MVAKDEEVILKLLQKLDMKYILKYIEIATANCVEIVGWLHREGNVSCAHILQ